MPIMYTNSGQLPVVPNLKSAEADACTSSYEQYRAQRQQVSMNPSDLQPVTQAFNNRVTTPMGMQSPKVEMGQYFVIPREELVQLLAKSPRAEFFHIVNGLRTGTGEVGFPVTIMAPIEPTTDNQGNAAYQVAKHPDAVYIETYPCPPDPRCPKSELIGTLLAPDAKLNDFKSLF